MKSDFIKNAAKIISGLIILASIIVFALSSRYEFQLLGKSRDACLRLDKWTGNVQLCPIDNSLISLSWKNTVSHLDSEKTAKNNKPHLQDF